MNARRSFCPLLLAGALLWTGCQTAAPPESDPDVVVTVAWSPVMRQTEPGLVFGANLGAWVSHTKLGTATRDLIKALRPSVARFPGGNLSNNYCWVTQKVSGNDHLVWEDWSWGIDVGRYIAFLKDIGCVPMFSLNPFDHTIDGETHSAASEAAALARVFVANGFSGAYYEIGNENDGSWNPMLSINDYTDRFIILAGAVKAVDPAARSMGPVVSGYNTTWINGFLNRLAALGATDLLDWISYHHYGGWISNSNQNGIDLNDPQNYGNQLNAVRGALDSRGLSRVKIAVTEINAAIWDTGCTRDQFTIKQGLWLADALGVSLRGADAANVWIHLHPGADPHSLIDDGANPPRPTKNYWPVALTAQTLSGIDPASKVDVLAATPDVAASLLTSYAVRKADGSLGVLIVNKSGQALEVAVDLPTSPQSVAGRRIGRAEYESLSGPAQVSVRLGSRRARLAVPATSIVGLEFR
ncbi:MAG: hypothetical protein QHH14_12160 [Clostridiales bacterium]|nr:hypothetical protein [Clostridiales bacterium]